MFVYHDKAALLAYKKWRQAWQEWRNDKTKAHNRRARRYESAFKRYVTIQALKEHLLISHEQSKRFTYRLDGQNMRVYYNRCFVGLAYIWPNIDDTGTTKVSFMLASEVYNEYWPT